MAKRSVFWPVLFAKHFRFVITNSNKRSTRTMHEIPGQGHTSMMDKFVKESVGKDMNVKIPSTLLKVQYGDIEVKPGQVLTPTQVKTQPQCLWSAETDSFYTIVMNDLDARSRANPTFREWHHWCVYNIPGSDVSRGEVLAAYVGAGPPKETKLHRYVLLLFRQPGQLPFAGVPRLTNRSGDGRPSQKVAEFAAAHDLGDPIAANFFQAEWDDYVPKLYDQLAGK